MESKKSKEKKPIQTWGFNLSDVERDVDLIVDKYRNPAIAPNTTVITSIDKLPENGFFFVMVSRRKDKLAIRQFGHDMDSATIEHAFIQVVRGIHPSINNENIGLA